MPPQQRRSVGQPQVCQEVKRVRGAEKGADHHKVGHSITRLETDLERPLNTKRRIG